MKRIIYESPHKKAHYYDEDKILDIEGVYDLRELVIIVSHVFGKNYYEVAKSLGFNDDEQVPNQVRGCW